MKRARLSIEREEIGEPSFLTQCTSTPNPVDQCSSSSNSSSSSSKLRMTSNGVVFENGSRAVEAVNGDSGFLVENGCEENGDSTAGTTVRKQGGSLIRRRKQRQIVGMDADIIRLIGQHLREMGLE